VGALQGKNTCYLRLTNLANIIISWYYMNNNEEAILNSFIRKYRPDLVELGKAFDLEMATALLHGMLISGFPAEDFDTCQTTIVGVIKKFVRISQHGKIEKKEEVDGYTVPTRETHVVETDENGATVETDTDRAAEALYKKYIECMTKSASAGQSNQESRKRRCKFVR
jgi:hypothetical protein